MTQPLFEQYKAALRRGHAALLEARPEEAVAAYEAAAQLVPDRALPHTSAAAALRQLGRRDEALAALDRALSVAPDDEASLQARAAALRELGRGADAAADLERLATVLAGRGKRDDALRTARRAVDVDATDARRALVERLAGSAEDGETWPQIDLPSPPRKPPAGPPPDPEELLAIATELLAAGSLAEARDRLLEAVAVHRAAGRPDAALDVCFQLLEIAPGDPAVHLAIANVQLDRGWQAFASDKLRLLLQLTSLTGDTQAAADAHALAAERIRDEALAGVAAG